MTTVFVFIQQPCIDCHFTCVDFYGRGFHFGVAEAGPVPDAANGLGGRAGAPQPTAAAAPPDSGQGLQPVTRVRQEFPATWIFTDAKARY